MAKYEELCTQILENVGGKENVTSAVHCMTRLRINYKDQSKINVDAIKGIKGVLGAQFSGTQFQVIIGQHVSDVYPEFCKIAGVGTADAIDENLDKEPFDIKKVPNKMLDYISGSIAPILPIMMGAGWFKLFYALLGPNLLNVLPETCDLMRLYRWRSRILLYASLHCLGCCAKNENKYSIIITIRCLVDGSKYFGNRCSW